MSSPWREKLDQCERKQLRDSSARLFNRLIGEHELSSKCWMSEPRKHRNGLKTHVYRSDDAVVVCLVLCGILFLKHLFF